MLRKGIFLLLILVASNTYSQKIYPQKYFGKPLDIPFILAGTFGELRSNHFHSGLDIKTKNKEGILVKAIADGYISRIKISLWGYGKAIYITHPNGYTSVYAHLKKFSPKIEAYVKQNQYKKQTFEIKIFPKKGEYRIKKGTVVAYSGNTGGSTGPHLHFEIRDTKTEEPINPMLFGYDIADHKKPVISKLVAYPLNDTSQVNQSNLPVEIQFKRLNNGNYIADKITAYGNIGFGIKTFDRQDAAFNRNGIYDLSLKVNGRLKYHHTLEKFSFDNTKYINLFMDYKAYFTKKQAIQKCFIEAKNKLNVYDKSLGDGQLKISDSLNYTTSILSKDFKGNTAQILIPIRGKNDSILVKKQVVKTNYFIDNNLFNKFDLKNVNLAFPKHTFYKDFYLDFRIGNDTVFVGRNTRPLDKNYTLTFFTDSLKIADKSKLYIAQIVRNKYANYKPTNYKKGKIYTSINTLGTYIVKQDTIMPTIESLNFKNKQWLTNYHFLKIKITDEDSGIKKYSATIDGQWVLFEFDAKKDILTYNFADKKFKKVKHELKLSVTDNVNNTKVYIATFFRKK
ncbi:MAG: M23 family metallopeptidase [Flavobacteriaceae bacterium]|nr:M23 family metallopeptidase [Flavobacteriaceae bacterium]